MYALVGITDANYALFGALEALDVTITHQSSVISHQSSVISHHVNWPTVNHKQRIKFDVNNPIAYSAAPSNIFKNYILCGPNSPATQSKSPRQALASIAA
jgi:hypothetical protein